MKFLRSSSFGFAAAFAAGLLVVLLAGASAARHHALALGACGLIAVFFLVGAAELRRLRRGHVELARLLAGEVPPTREAWLQQLPESLRAPLLQRLEGQGVGLPAPQLAPALAALLVLLGMLGSFVGLMLTLGGTASALGQGGDLAALRAALAAPVQGLGLAFSASVAGAAASAALGLMVLITRRERLQLLQRLESLLLPGQPLHAFTVAWRREQQDLAAREELPRLVGAVQRLAEGLAAQQAAFHAQQQAVHQQFVQDAQASQGQLTRTLQQQWLEGLQASAQHSAQLLGQTVDAQGRRLADALAQQQQSQLHSLSQQRELLDAWLAQQQALLAGQLAALTSAQQQQLEAQQQRQAEAQTTQQALLQQAWRELLAAQQAQDAQQQQALQALLAEQAQQAVQQQQRLSEGFAARLEASGQAQQSLLQSGGQALQDQAQRSLAQQQHANEQLAALLGEAAQVQQAQMQATSEALLRETRTLLQAAGEAPRAAAEVLAAAQQQLARSLDQDQAVLAERAELLETVRRLLTSLQAAAGEQREAIDALVQRGGEQIQALVERAERTFEAASQRFDAQASGSGEQLAAAAASLGAGASGLQLASDSLQGALQRSQAAQDALLAQLASLQAELAGAMTRSDEQFAYTVAQARELVELSMAAQQQLLQRLPEPSDA